MRRICVLVTATILAVTAAAGPVTADPGVSAAAQATLEPLNPSSGSSPALNARITSFDQRLAFLSGSQDDLDAQQTALDGRVAAYNKQSQAVLAALNANDEKLREHNTRVAEYPNGAPPAIADELNAEADALNAEQQRLKQQANAIADEGDAIKAKQQKLKDQKQKLDTQRSTLQTERRQLVLKMTNALLALLTPRPTADIRPAYGGDQGRPATLGTRVGGGDSASGSATDAALNQYAKLHNVRVDGRPVNVVLSSSTVSRMPAADAGVLQPIRTFDGLAEKPDGTDRALFAHNAGQEPTPAQKAYDDAINNGGTGTAIVDGQKVSVTEVQTVDVTAGPDIPQERRDLVLGLDTQHGVRAFAQRYGYEHLMDVSRGSLRRELLGRLVSPNYRVHVTLKDFSPTDYPNVLARGEAFENGEKRIPLDENGKIRPYAANWERAPGFTDWEMYLLHTIPGVLERTTFYDENGNVVPDPFLTTG